jgi:hypothetical protein
VQQYECHFGPGQLWVPEPQDFVPGAETQPRRLRSFSSWQCLDVAGNSLVDGSSVGTFACKLANDPSRGNQILRIEPQ